jgi:hypothetical protein
MNMNKVLLAVGLLLASTAIGQTTQSTRSSSTTTTNSSNYNNANRNSNGSMSSGMSSTTNTSGAYNSNSSMGTGSVGATSSYSNTNGSMSSGSTMGTSSTMGTGSMMGTGSTSSGSMNSGSYNSMGTSGATTTTPSTGSSYDSNNMNSTGSSSYNTSSTTTTYSDQRTTRDRKMDYKNFTFGIYAGLNTTRFRGEDIDTENPAGRLGYQAGFFVRGGGRLYGQLGAEYFTSSSNYFRPGDGQSVNAIRDQINIQYIQIPAYIGYKLTESDRGISAIRVQVGLEYANRISANSNSFNLSNSEIKAGSFNGLGQLGFDIGPLLIDLTYHYGLSDAVQINTFQGSTRRILSASVGFKF